MNVVVTGHHGYIGSVLVRVLAECGHVVHGIDSFLYRGCDLDRSATNVPALELDVRDVRAEHLEGADAVVHLAALSNDPLGALAPELTRDVNVGGTLAVARAARDAGVERFLFASSCSMYGRAGDEAVREDAPLRPLTAYAESKARAEEALLELADESFSPVLMRNATAYGVSPRMRVDLVLNNLVGWAHTTGRVRILSDGTPWRPLVHVEDIALVTVQLLEAPRTVVHGEAFNVGADDENHQVRDLADMVEGVMPGCEIEYAEGAGPDSRSYRVDFGKLHRAVPQVALRWTARRGVEEVASAYRSTALSEADFHGDRFTRLKRLERLLHEGRVASDLRHGKEHAGA